MRRRRAWGPRYTMTFPRDRERAGKRKRLREALDQLGVAVRDVVKLLDEDERWSRRDPDSEPELDRAEPFRRRNAERPPED
jgi:hypothetical protein